MMQRMPVLFLGHGSPMNALADNRWTRAWAALGRVLPRPRVILTVSAHWYIADTAMTAQAALPTIHDFGGFPPALYAVEYPAPGQPELLSRLRDLLAPVPVRADVEWGLDHGTWSVLRHLFPAADMPVVQLSIDATQPPAFHYALGRKLRVLREQGVLILGSGNVVHNLRRLRWNAGSADAYDWATRFEAAVRTRIANREHAPLMDLAALGPDAALAVPTPDHYLPLLYILGASDIDDEVSFPTAGIDVGSISMLSVKFG